MENMPLSTSAGDMFVAGRFEDYFARTPNHYGAEELGEMRDEVDLGTKRTFGPSGLTNFPYKPVLNRDRDVYPAPYYPCYKPALGSKYHRFKAKHGEDEHHFLDDVGEPRGDSRHHAPNARYEDPEKPKRHEEPVARSRAGAPWLSSASASGRPAHANPRGNQTAHANKSRADKDKGHGDERSAGHDRSDRSEASYRSGHAGSGAGAGTLRRDHATAGVGARDGRGQSRAAAVSVTPAMVPKSIKRIGPVQAMIREAPELCALLETTAKEVEGWEVVSAKDNVKTSKKVYEGVDNVCFKSVTKIHATTDAVYDFLNNADVNWDGFSVCDVVETYPDNHDNQDMCLEHVGYPGSLLTSGKNIFYQYIICCFIMFYHSYINIDGLFIPAARDFCLFWAGSKRAHGGYVIVTKSVSDHPSVPVDSGYERGEVKWGGYVITQSITDKNHSVVFSIMCVDAKGWMPGTIGDSIAETHVEKIRTLRDECEVWATRNKKRLAEKKAEKSGRSSAGHSQATNSRHY